MRGYNYTRTHNVVCCRYADLKKVAIQTYDAIQLHGNCFNPDIRFVRVHNFAKRSDYNLNFADRRRNCSNHPSRNQLLWRADLSDRANSCDRNAYDGRLTCWFRPCRSCRTSKQYKQGLRSWPICRLLRNCLHLLYFHSGGPATY